MKRIDLNVDIGEGFPNDDALLQAVTSANICCGEHAGSWAQTAATVKKCQEMSVRYGAHPGFPDREGMGRLDPTEDQLDAYRSSLLDQAERFVMEFGGAYIKPHGAWYNLLTTPFGNRLGDWARLIALEIAAEYGLPLMLLGGCPFARQLQEKGVPVISEGFADRAYTPDGSLVPRSQPAAVHSDEAIILKQAAELALRVDSLCLHGDTAGCVAFAKRVRESLSEQGFEVAHWP